MSKALRDTWLTYKEHSSHKAWQRDPCSGLWLWAELSLLALVAQESNGWALWGSHRRSTHGFLSQGALDVLRVTQSGGSADLPFWVGKGHPSHLYLQSHPYYHSNTVVCCSSILEMDFNCGMGSSYMIKGAQKWVGLWGLYATGVLKVFPKYCAGCLFLPAAGHGLLVTERSAYDSCLFRLILLCH